MYKILKTIFTGGKRTKNMRILHTADWHIGQRLHERQRTDEHEKFLDWLLYTIQEHNVELLLVSGDIFDTALPSSESTNLYYEFLYRLYKETNAYAVIIAGNHDSASHLEAPREFLKRGRIYVVGTVNDPDGRIFHPDKCIVKIPDGPASPRVAVAAVPYLSESKLQHISFETEIEKSERYRERLRTFYAKCVADMPAELPKILMGHLFVQGGKISDSERNIQIGGATAIHASDFPKDVSYVALGHLHRPQIIKGTDYPIRYSGSPIPMRFNEAGYQKKVYLLELADDGTLVCDREIEVPISKVSRELCTVEGNEDSVLSEARKGNWAEKYIQVKLKLNAPEVGIGDKIRKAFSDHGGDVLSVELELPETKIVPLNDPGAIAHPKKIFELFHKAKFNDQPPDETLTQTFSELVQMVEESHEDM